MPESLQLPSSPAGAGTTLRAVVGVGASAGGVDALRTFFANVRPGTGAAYVVILHLSPDYDSHLAEVLGTATALPVTKVTEPVALEPDHVYVIPPNATLAIGTDGVLEGHARVTPEHRRAPVDLFFRSLADAYHGRAIAIVMSGTGLDGSSGLKRVKEYGGLVLAQEPLDAQYPDMPRNAIHTGLVDRVLPVAEMPAHVASYVSRLSPEVPTPSDGGGHDDVAALRDVLTVLRVRTGQDFSNYKVATLARRIDRRMNVREMTSLDAYAQLMRDDPAEAAALMKDLLISVTNFFRDADAFEALQQRVIPALFQKAPGHRHVRVWVAGCATGEEAYSLAMLLAEFGSTLLEARVVQVFATDLDEAAIATAREGYYTAPEMADVSDARLQRFFTRENGGFRVRREIREMVLFAHHNLIKHPPFSHLDLVSCRNLLIYLNRGVQERVIETFHFALRPGGFLFLGTSESPEGLSQRFATVDKAAHIYESRAAAKVLASRRPDATTTPVGPPLAASRRAGLPSAERIVPADLHQRLLEEYAPPSLLVSPEHQVVHVSERAERYLQVSGGEPSREVLKLVHPDLRPVLRTALSQAVRDRSAVQVHGLRMAAAGEDVTLTITVRPVLQPGHAARGFLLVLFDEQTGPRAEEPVITLPGTAEPLAQQLDEELEKARAELRETIQQYETQVEEAKASNEELQAMNEELRSSAEELETSKEELQSVNEELITVNQELKIEIEELGLTNNDFQNLINSTDIGTIFLDRYFRVKLSTPRAQEVFNLLDSDSGRPLAHITSTLQHDGLLDDARQVLERLQPIEREVQTVPGRWYLLRVLPYRTMDDRIDGIVITLQDITHRREAELRVRASEERLRLLIDSATDYAIFTMTQDGLIDSWNSGAQRMFHYTAGDILGQSASVLFTPEDREHQVFDEELRRASMTGRVDDERWLVRKDGTRLFCRGVTTRLGESVAVGFAKIARDLMDQRRNETALLRSSEELEACVRMRTLELQAEVTQHADAEERVMHLLRAVVTAQEDERRRIARDLHDQLGQQLTALRLALERHRGHCAAGDGTQDDDLERALVLAGSIDAEVDFLAWELRPAALDDLGLAAALPRYIKEWSEHYGVPAEFRASGFQGGQLSPDAEVTFYRVAQEALNNVAKHAHASNVGVLLERRATDVVLVVEDNGVGFDPTVDGAGARGFGLVGMRERATLVDAQLDVESTPGGGTTVFLRCAVAPVPGDAPRRS